jgi:hypothetical protein
MLSVTGAINALLLNQTLRSIPIKTAAALGVEIGRSL